ncbi:MAG: nucleotidyltransferase family protein [Pirellulaceae bacterium]|nr:nucleotidyltransferase family protein [Pirellulaceae bacterium]
MNARSFAIVPAAGRSVRMGQPKLLLESGGQPLLSRVLRAWQAANVSQIVVIMRAADAPLAEIATAAGVAIVQPPVDPPDMKTSIRWGLEFVARNHQPTAGDHWLVAPADMPGLSPTIIAHLIGQSAIHPQRILIPTLAGQRGHPVLLPWPLAAGVGSLAADQGLNSLIVSHDPLLVPCDAIATDAVSSFADVDTPEDWGAFRH